MTPMNVEGEWALKLTTFTSGIGIMIQQAKSKPKIIVEPDERALAKAGAALFEQTLTAAVQSKGKAAAAISGGSTPRHMNRLLALSPTADRIPWEDIHLFWVDDRMVAADDPASNYGAARDDFITKVPIPPAQVYPMPVLDPPSEGAAAYIRDLKRFFGTGIPAFDLIFLGIGTDGHTASLFPDQADAHRGTEWVLSVKGGNPDVDRLTLNYPVLNQAAMTVILVSGQGKAEMVRTLLCSDEVRYPPQRIHPESGRLIWLLDQPAASLLPDDMVSM